MRDAIDDGKLYDHSSGTPRPVLVSAYQSSWSVARLNRAAGSVGGDQQRSFAGLPWQQEWLSGAAG
jgi:hypothetical protein